MSNFRSDTDAVLIERMPIKLLYISQAKYEGDWHSTPHAHQCTEFFYVVSGSGKFQVEEITFPVAADEMVIINPSVQHTEMGNEDRPLEYIVLGIEGGDFIMEGSLDPRYLAFNCGRLGKEFLFYMKEMQRELEQRPDKYANVANNLLEVFLIKLMRYRKISVIITPPINSAQKCGSVKRYIDANYHQPLTLDDLALVAHLNKYYLVHVFTKENGVSPINYLIKRRLEESRHLLSTTNHNIAQISQILGFSSPSYFSQCFRRAEQMSPKAYREKIYSSGK